jgi:GntR family transcriptional repressor for pyruvate dehydrogenase complex
MEAIKRVPIVQQVEERLRLQIEDGQYAPGEKLPTEMELCQQLGVGRGTIREAFCLLQARGYIESKPGRGAYVSQSLPTADNNIGEWLVANELDLRDAIMVRRALEPMAARRMAEQGRSRDISALERLHTQFITAAQNQDAPQVAALDEAFHSAIMEGSGIHLLSAIDHLVTQGMKAFRFKTFQLPQNIRNAVIPHSNIMQAIQSRDGNGAEDAMRAHLDLVQTDLSTIVTTSA